MSEVRVSQPHTLSATEAKGRIAEFETMMSKYGVKAAWSGSSAKLKGTGVTGSIDITASSVNVLVKLGLMAKAVGVDPAKLEASIRKRLAAAFADEA